MDFVVYNITQVSRKENSKADALARLASAIDANLTRLIPIEFLQNPSTNNEEN